MPACLVILLLALGLCAGAQPSNNLVLNPGFEKRPPGNTYPDCTYCRHSTAFDAALFGWTTFGLQTPDLIAWRPDAYGDCFFPKPHGGDHAVGIITYLPKNDTGRNDDFHEFVQGKLRFPLVAGVKYQVEFYIRQSDSTATDHLKVLYGEKQVILPVAAGNLGIHFSFNQLGSIDRDIVPQILFEAPIATPPGEWIKLGKTYTPDRPYLFFTIGNFSRDSQTPTTLPNSQEVDEFNLKQGEFSSRKKRVAYYCLDDFSVTPVEEKPNPLAADLKKKKAYTFRHVNFETGKWDLLPESLPELDALAAFLTENQGVKALIAGHTDDVGKDEDNLVLSEKRAEAVVKYLTGKGIAEGRLQFRGYGEQHPVKPNDTAEGRKENRRVECRVQ